MYGDVFGGIGVPLLLRLLLRLWLLLLALLCLCLLSQAPGLAALGSALPTEVCVGSSVTDIHEYT